MHQLITTSGNMTMTSREIADLVEKRHDNVRRTIETLAAQGVIGSPQIEETEQINNLGLPRKISHFVFTGEQGKRDSIIVVAQLSPEFTARLVDRWQELERRAITAPLTPEMQIANAILLAGRMIEEQKVLLEQRDKLISDIQPKAQALDRISTADGSLCITDAAKTLQIQPKKFFHSLQASGWIYKRAGSDHWVGYQDKLQHQLLEHKTTTVSRSDGSEKITEQVRITAKGLVKLAKMFEEAE